VKVFNPAFDVTDHELISGVITQRGVTKPPFGEAFAKIFTDCGASGTICPGNKTSASSLI
jgi:hypothetical protein